MFSESSHPVPTGILEQPLSEFHVSAEKQPVLRSDQSGAATPCTKLQAAFYKARCKVGLGFGMHTLTIILEHIILFAASEVRHVGRDERELAGENFRRLGDALCRHRHFMRVVISGFL